MKPPFRERLRRLSCDPRSLPVFILAVCLLAFGLLTFALGFYQDDWKHLYYFYREGADGLKRFLVMDSRPLAFVVYDAFFAVFGVRPLSWHIGLLILRSLTALASWGVLNIIWEGFRRENAVVSLVFILYPVFLLQPLAVAYSLHWAMYLVYMLSVLLMMHSVKRGSLYLTTAAVLLQAFHLLMMEYYFGIELLRPVFLWLAFSGLTRGQRLKRVFSAWLPYLGVTLLYLIYRASYARLFGYERFGSLFVLDTLATQPLALIPFYVRALFQDFTAILLGSWYDTLKPDLFDFATLSGTLIWVVVVAVAALGCAYFNRLQAEEKNTALEHRWARQMIAVGLGAILFGLLPGWMVGNTVQGSNPLWNDRFALGAMFGAGMVWTGFIYLFVREARHRHLLAGVLIALAVGANLRADISFKHSWEKQLSFYWQLSWRAPYIQPGTAFLSDSEFLFFMGNYPTSFALNTLYPAGPSAGRLSYWLYASGEHIDDWTDFRAGTPLDNRSYGSGFAGFSSDSLAISFVPEESQCLWILRPKDRLNPYLPPLTYQYLPASNLDRIRAAAPAGGSPPEAILGPEPAHDWCYYFEKADLARQFNDWQQVVQLWQQAVKAGVHPGSGVELIPFIEGHARLEDWKTAGRLTLQSSRITGHMAPQLCAVWRGLRGLTPDSSDRDAALREIYDRLGCTE